MSTRPNELHNAILYEDNHLLVINKPAGLLSQADSSGDLDVLTQAKSFIKEKYNKPGNVYIGLVHRLDRNVSGVMVLARTSKSAARLSQSIREHQMQKKYVALVEGVPAQKHGKCIDYLIKDNSLKKAIPVSSKNENAQKAELEYSTLSTFSMDELRLKNLNKKTPRRFSLLSINLITGRFHQIRMQMSQNIGPIVGDKKYKSSTALKNTFLCLHCCSLSFPHPIKKEMVEYSAQIPKNWGIDSPC